MWRGDGRGVEAVVESVDESGRAVTVETGFSIDVAGDKLHMSISRCLPLIGIFHVSYRSPDTRASSSNSYIRSESNIGSTVPGKLDRLAVAKKLQGLSGSLYIAINCRLICGICFVH